MSPAHPIAVPAVPLRASRRTATGSSSRSRRGAWPSLLVVLLIAACTDRAGVPDVEASPDDLPAPSAETSPGVPSAPSVGPHAAPDVVFRTLDGRRLPLREAGGPVLVSFWSTSCTVCLAEMPELARLHADYAPRGFELVAVAMPHDRPDTVLELAEARALPFPVALDIDGRVLAAFEPVPGTPTSFLIAADGRVVERHVGSHDLPALRRLLDDLLEGDADDGERSGAALLPSRASRRA